MGFAPQGNQPQFLLKHSPDQKWFYYPDMTNDEVIAFKQFHYMKGSNETEQ